MAEPHNGADLVPRSTIYWLLGMTIAFCVGNDWATMGISNSYITERLRARSGYNESMREEMRARFASDVQQLDARIRTNAENLRAMMIDANLGKP